MPTITIDITDAAKQRLDLVVADYNTTNGTLLTFDKGGVDCTIQAVKGGGDLYASAWGCKGEIYDEVHVIYNH